MRIQLNRRGLSNNLASDCVSVPDPSGDHSGDRIYDPDTDIPSVRFRGTPPAGSVHCGDRNSDRLSMRESLVKAEELAKILECTPQRIYALVRNGVLPQPPERGLYHLVQSVTSYIRFLNSERNKDLKEEGHYKALNLKLESELRQMKIDTMKKNLLDSDMVWEAWEKIGVAIKTKLQQFPTGYADQLSVMDEPKSIKATLEKAIDEILSELNHVEIKVKSVEDEP